MENINIEYFIGNLYWIYKKIEYKLGKCRLSIYIYIYMTTYEKFKVHHLTKYDLFLSRNEI